MLIPLLFFFTTITSRLLIEAPAPPPPSIDDTVKLRVTFPPPAGISRTVLNDLADISGVALYISLPLCFTTSPQSVHISLLVSDFPFLPEKVMDGMIICLSKR
jgi:hypothetical protein